jgi:hypothetical protein
MRRFSLLAVAALSSLAVAQSPLNTLTGGTNQGNVGGGLYFDLQINSTVTITQIDFRCGATTVAGTGTLDVFLGPTTYSGNVANPALWTFVGSATAAVAPSTVAIGVLTTPFALAPGSYGVALKANAFSHGYTNGVTCTSTTVPGSCSNSLFSNNEMTLRAGAAQNAFLSGGIFTPRIFNGAIHYTPGGNPIRVAAWEAYGQGCYANYRSFYELFPNPAGLNLGNGNPVSAIRLSLAAGSYNVTAVNSPVVTPISAPIALPGPDNTFLASSVLPGSTLPFPIPHPLNGGVQVAPDLEISTDGYIVPSPNTMPNDSTPAVADFLSQQPRWCPHWKNMDPLNPVSSMHVELDAASSALLVTWNNVADVALTTTSTFQVAFFPSGDVEFRYGAMSLNGGGTYPVMIGWANGGGALDPGNMEIATSLPFSTEASENDPLTLGMSGRPVLGQTVNLVTGAIPAGTAFGAITLGFTQYDPGLTLAGFGMDGCFAFNTYDAVTSFPVSGTQDLFPLVIPNTPALNGGLLYGQSLSISAGFNTLGVISSNGVRMSLGSL